MELHEECGVFGVWAPQRDVARLTYFALHALQHRGQDSAGIAVGDGQTVLIRKDLGLVTEVFTNSDLDALPGKAAVGGCGAAHWVFHAKDASPSLGNCGDNAPYRGRICNGAGAGKCPLCV